MLNNILLAFKNILKMKFLILTVCFITICSCAVLKSTDISSWEQFKTFYGKSYASTEEETFRKTIFEQNLAFIAAANHQNVNGAQLGVNEFSDQSDEEFFARNAHLSWEFTLNQSRLMEEVPLLEEDSGQYYESLPAHWDWREHFRWNPVDNQRQCGSCWAFATVQSVEAAYAIHRKVHVRLSKQELVDCTLNSYNRHYINRGCQSGYTTEALKYFKEHGALEEHFYTYRAVNGQCQLPHLGGHKRYQITDYRRLAGRGPDAALQSAVKNFGPVVVNINDHDAVFKHYRSGVIRNLMPNIALTTHSVLLVGWGSEHGVDYWIIRNSWGEGWGDHGHAKIERHHNLMGINNIPVFPVLH